MNIILASSSTYRKQLLKRILPEFECLSPNVDEAPLPDEPPAELAKRLAELKVDAVARSGAHGLIIGSDQVAWLGGEQLCKPETRDVNIEHLIKCQGKEVAFFTSVALYNTTTGKLQSSVEIYRTRFRQLNEQQICRYVDREQAYDCAGGFKMEGLGIVLFESIRGDDPNSLVGLPLIRLIAMLENEGIDVL